VVNGDSQLPEKELPDVLTGIHIPYTVSDTPERLSEVDDIMINNFLSTLAEIALSVASRKQHQEKLQ